MHCAGQCWIWWSAWGLDCVWTGCDDQSKVQMAPNALLTQQKVPLLKVIHSKPLICLQWERWCSQFDWNICSENMKRFHILLLKLTQHSLGAVPKSSKVGCGWLSRSLDDTAVQFTLHSDALWCTVMHYDALWCTIMHCDALWCTVMHRDAL